MDLHLHLRSGEIHAGKMIRLNSAVSPLASARTRMAARPPVNLGNCAKINATPSLSEVAIVDSGRKLLPRTFRVTRAFATEYRLSPTQRVTSTRRATDSPARNSGSSSSQTLNASSSDVCETEKRSFATLVVF